MTIKGNLMSQRKKAKKSKQILSLGNKILKGYEKQRENYPLVFAHMTKNILKDG